MGCFSQLLLVKRVENAINGTFCTTGPPGIWLIQNTFPPSGTDKTFRNPSLNITHACFTRSWVNNWSYNFQPVCPENVPDWMSPHCTDNRSVGGSLLGLWQVVNGPWGIGKRYLWESTGLIALILFSSPHCNNHGAHQPHFNWHDLQYSEVDARSRKMSNTT